jgi:hypothetical protein
MRPDELTAHCRRQIELMGPEARVTLVLPRRASGRSEYTRLTGRAGPKGYILCENGEGHTLAQFHAAELIAWVEKAQAAARQLATQNIAAGEPGP